MSPFKISLTKTIVISKDRHENFGQMFIHSRKITWKLLLEINPLYWLFLEIMIGFILLKGEGKYSQLCVRRIKYCLFINFPHKIFKKFEMMELFYRYIMTFP